MWRKSSHSEGGVDVHCVELAALRGAVGVRDSKHPDHGHFTTSPANLGRLLEEIKSGAYDR